MSKVKIWKIRSPGSPGLLTVLEPALELASLDSTASLLPQGVYTTLRTYPHGKVINLEAHFERLEESARLLGYNLHLERSVIRKALKEAIEQYPPEQDLRLRMVVDLENEPGETYIACETLRGLPRWAYEQGVKVITLAYERDNPQAKSTEIIQKTKGVRTRLVGEINEALLIDGQGFIREGLSSNFFAVREGMLLTAGEGILSGMTRQVVLELAEQAGVKVVFQPIALAEVDRLQEAFITSASRGILPVRQINDCVIGDGKPGPLTRLLSDLYHQSIQDQLEEILS